MTTGDAALVLVTFALFIVAAVTFAIWMLERGQRKIDERDDDDPRD